MKKIVLVKGITFEDEGKTCATCEGCIYNDAYSTCPTDNSGEFYCITNSDCIWVEVDTDNMV